MIGLKNIVCKEFNIKVKDLDSKCRLRNFVDARKVYSSIMRDYYKRGYTHIGNDLNKNHATIINLIKGHENLIVTDTFYIDAYNNCINKLECADNSHALSNKLQLLMEVDDQLEEVKEELQKTKRKIYEITERKDRILSNKIP